MGWGAAPGERRGGKPKGYKAPHTIESEEARKYIVERVRERLSVYIDKLDELATEGKIEALKELLERGVGKVKDTVDMNVREQAPLEDAVQEDHSIQKD